MTIERVKIGFSELEYRANPFEAFGRLRKMGTVVPARMPVIGNMWLATTYEAVTDTLKNDKLFCRDPKNAGGGNFFIFRVMAPLLFRRLANNMIAKDEPDHRRLRSLVDQAFHRQEISEMRPCIEQLVDRQLDLIEHGFSRQNGNASMDLVEHLARPVPLGSICELLGLPSEDRPKFRKWFSSFANFKSFAGILKILPGLYKTQNYLRQQFEQVRREPRPGLMSALVQADADGDRLDNEELLSMVLLLLLAGHETTVHLLSSSILTVLQMPDVRQALLTDWTKVDATVEEMLRYNSPVQFAKPRFVRDDTEFHGQALKRGEMVMPVLACANYDPARFDDPTEFILDRPNNNHMTFGFGPHVCLGLKLARLETVVVLERLFTRWPNLQCAFDSTKPDWSKRMGMRSLSSLAVKAAS